MRFIKISCFYLQLCKRLLNRRRWYLNFVNMTNPSPVENT
jgi:hypothetical protein